MREIDVADLETALRDGATLVDVREPAECAEGHVPGAVLLPMSQLATRVGELAAAGLDAVNVTGGTAAWIRSGRPVEGSVTNDLTVLTIETPTLGDRSYLVHDGQVAFAVGPAA